MLSKQTEEIVQATLPVVASNLAAIINKFYERLLNNHPELKNVFNLTNQKTGTQQMALTGSIAAFATNYKNITSLQKMITQIAHKHCSIGITAEQYDIVGTNLLAAIDEVLGSIVTDEIRNAWGELYWSLADILIAEEKNLYATSNQQQFKDYQIVKKTDESKNVFSLYLKPVDGILSQFLPGQFISIKVDLGSNEQIRQYSLSDATNNEYVRITIKCEDSHEQEITTVSKFIYDNLNINDICQISTPYGTFTLNDYSKDITFISAGVGITPVMSMLKTLNLRNYKRKINFIYLTENSDYHIFKEEIAKIESPNLNKYIYYNVPNQHDSIGKDYVKTQFDTQELEKYISQDTNYYLCASSGLIEMIESTLIKSQINKDNIYHEIFQPNKRA